MRAKYLRWREHHPRIYASRHVLAGAAQVVCTILGVALAFKLLLAFPLPRIDVDVPRFDVPSLPLPDLEVPEWVLAIGASKPYWLPIAIGLAMALREVRRRQRRAPD